jgi:hypothetical protein
MTDPRKKDPWTDPDPQPGDFDEDLAAMGPEDIQVIEPGNGARVVHIGNEDVDEYLKKKRRRETEAKR